MRKDILLPVLALAGGGLGFGLRFWQYSSAFDTKTQLFRSGAPATIAMIAALAVLGAVFLVLIRGGKKPQDYTEGFYCPSAGYMTLMTAGSFLLLATAALGLFEFREQLSLWRMGYGYPLPMMLGLTVVLCVPAAVGGLMVGKGNYRGTLPEGYPVMAALPAYVLLPWIVALYQEHSRQPEIMIFLVPILAVICGELGFYHAAGMAFGRVRVKQCLFFSLMGIVLLLTALADRPGRFFAVMDLACVLLLLAQTMALARSAYGPAWPRPVLEREEVRE